MVMEYVEGRTFGQLLDSGPLPLARALPLLLQALEGIGHAHAAGVIHRDIKPSNLMLAGNGCVKVMDFGVARCLGTVRQTRDGHMIGTAQYMSPEQVRGLESDARSDVYALGVLAYEMLTGFVPFDSESEYELCRAQVEEPPRAPRTLAPDLSPELEAVILRALEKDPAARFPSVHALREALQAVTPGRTARARRAASTRTRSRPASSRHRFVSRCPPSLPQSLARGGARHAHASARAWAWRCRSARLALAALLLGAKLVRQQPAADELAVAAAAATRTAARAPPPEQLRIALPDPPRRLPHRAAQAPAPQVGERAQARATIGAGSRARREARRAKPSLGGTSWVIRKR